MVEAFVKCMYVTVCKSILFNCSFLFVSFKFPFFMFLDNDEIIPICHSNTFVFIAVLTSF